MLYKASLKKTNLFFMTATAAAFALAAAFAQVTQAEVVGSDHGRPILGWAKIDGAESYHLEISTNAAFSPIALAVDLTENQYTFKKARPGKYFWRVFPIDTSGMMGIPKPISTLRIALKAPAIEPLDQPVDLGASNERTKLKWKRLKFAKRYELQLAANPEFSGASSKKTRQNFASIRFKEPGMFYWRVRAVNKRGKPLGHFSEFSTVAVIDSRVPKLNEQQQPQQQEQQPDVQTGSTEENAQASTTVKSKPKSRTISSSPMRKKP